MHNNLSLLATRIERTCRERLAPAVLNKIAEAKVYAYPQKAPQVKDDHDYALPGSPLSFEQGVQGWMDHLYQPFPLPSPWGYAWQTYWFRVEIPAPSLKLEPQEELEIWIDLGWEDHSAGFQCEALVYNSEGRIIKAVNPRNAWVKAQDLKQDDGSYLCWLEAAANPLILGVPPFIPTDDSDITSSSKTPIYTFRQASLNLVHTTLRELVADLTCFKEIAAQLAENDAWRAQILYTCSRALDLLDLKKPELQARAAREILAPLYEHRAAKDELEVTAVGHAHIDTAWLWPLRETRRKVGRTYANVVNLLDSGYDFTFAMPAAQHLAWLKEDYPQLFARVQAWAAKGKMVPVGGMWVEPDAVLPGSEAMARQLVYGMEFFKKEFGINCQQMWLPDSFGYSAALPQLARLAGLKWFLTQKISWNQVNEFPHTSFWWEGIDGTRLYTHFPAADTYNCDLGGIDLDRARRKFKDRGIKNQTLVPFGYGDGGGGPVREMIEQGQRKADLAGSPKVRFAHPDQFLERMAGQITIDEPVFKGELYLELHRGTFTSQIKTKQGNRYSEALINQGEFWAARAAFEKDAPYPYEELESIWRRLLTGQFHDILPGSSIAWVHRENAGMHQVLAQELGRLKARALATNLGIDSKELGAEILPLSRRTPDFLAEVPSANLPGAASLPGTVVAANHQSRAVRAERILWEAGLEVAEGSRKQDCGQDLVVLPGQIVRLEHGGSATAGPWQSPEASRIENEHTQVQIDIDGAVSSMFIKSCSRQLVPEGRKLGRLQLFEDFPNMWDAWDLDSFYRGTQIQMPAPEAMRKESPTSVSYRYRFAASSAVINYALVPDTNGIRISVDLDWAESEKVLKLALPVAIHTDKARFETQFGDITRDIHTNTSWQAQAFELSLHRWMMLSEEGFNLSLANSGSYGMDILRENTGFAPLHDLEAGGAGQSAGLTGGSALLYGAQRQGQNYVTMRPTLARAPRYPDPHTDRGQHRFVFLLSSVAGAEAALSQAELLNNPPAIYLADRDASWLQKLANAQNISQKPEENGDSSTCTDGWREEAFFKFAPALVKGVKLESLKLAQDKSGDLILRLYEQRGQKTRYCIEIPRALRVCQTDLLENPITKWEENKTLKGSANPYQIITLRVSKNRQN